MPNPHKCTRDTVIPETKFGRWTVIGFSHCHRYPSGRLRDYWLCRCECGVERAVKAVDLHKGSSVSCGCYSRDAVIARSTKHGMFDLPEYRTWVGMRTRTQNEGYEYHADRGIKTCQGFDTFPPFYAAIGPKPTPTHQIDRRDNDGHYSCGKCAECLERGWPINVHWVTPKEQANNRRLPSRAA